MPAEPPTMTAPPPSPLREAPFKVAVTAEDGGLVRLAVEGCLDGEAGRVLLDVATSATAADVSRLEVDLDRVCSFTAEGAVAIRRCRALSPALRRGVTMRAGQGPGRRALAESYAADADDAWFAESAATPGGWDPSYR